MKLPQEWVHHHPRDYEPAIGVSLPFIIQATVKLPQEQVHHSSCIRLWNSHRSKVAVHHPKDWIRHRSKFTTHHPNDCETATGVSLPLIIQATVKLPQEQVHHSLFKRLWTCLRSKFTTHHPSDCEADTGVSSPFIMHMTVKLPQE